MKARHVNVVFVVLILSTVIAASGLTVNPWPRDGWYPTRHLLVGTFPGGDNYTPIAAPAILYSVAHIIAGWAKWDLAGEFYLASALQNLLVLISACFVYYTLKGLRRSYLAGTIAIGYLLLILSTGLTQAFWSESVVIFLMSAVILTLVDVMNDNNASAKKLWRSGILCGALVGMLVVTRVIPILLIPAIPLLLLHRMPAAQITRFTAAIALVTTLLIAGAILANHYRFGRYELTNCVFRRRRSCIPAQAGQ